jgi:hypothetical protein
MSSTSLRLIHSIEPESFALLCMPLPTTFDSLIDRSRRAQSTMYVDKTIPLPRRVVSGRAERHSIILKSDRLPRSSIIRLECSAQKHNPLHIYGACLHETVHSLTPVDALWYIEIMDDSLCIGYCGQSKRTVQSNMIAATACLTPITPRTPGHCLLVQAPCAAQILRENVVTIDPAQSWSLCFLDRFGERHANDS